MVCTINPATTSRLNILCGFKIADSDGTKQHYRCSHKIGRCSFIYCRVRPTTTQQKERGELVVNITEHCCCFEKVTETFNAPRLVPNDHLTGTAIIWPADIKQAGLRLLGVDEENTASVRLFAH